MVGQDPQTKHPQPNFPSQQQPNPGDDTKMNPKPDWGETSYTGHNRLKGKTAVVTGGDSGIGRAVCLAYAKEGCPQIVISYLNEHEDAKETKRMVEKAGAKAILVASDIATDAGCKQVIDTAMQTLKQIDILVLNAAYQGKALKHPLEPEWDRVTKTFNTNIVAMFAIARYAHPYLKKGASIITSSSIQGYQPAAMLIDYATTKGAIVAWTKALAPALIKEGIRVNSVAPGPVWTPLIPSSFDTKTTSEFGKDSPIGRPAQPVELSPCYVFLASEDASNVIGEILSCTGGTPTA